MASTHSGSPPSESPLDELPRYFDLDPRSAIPLAAAFAALAVVVWFMRSVQRTLTLTAIATLLALALNPLVELVKRRTG
ncbi:MAG TPA: hypothetical protein VFR41_14290, partial [Acidimicrobiia bacterium]|nr:hypothetical protein [Acidimicrobiia bacterium]